MKKINHNRVKAISVVIPIYNEADHIVETLENLVSALKVSEIEFEVIIVDNASTDRSSIMISEWRYNELIYLINLGYKSRLDARIKGIEEAQNDLILLLDSRVRLEKDSIKGLITFLEANRSAMFVNGNIEISDNENVYAVFWETLVRIGWGAHQRKIQDYSFGIEEFDLYPKGTGCFVGPKIKLLEAMLNYQDFAKNNSARLSDDTRVLRELCKQSNIWVVRDFKALYIPRNTLFTFFKNAYYRGNTFIDSYWDAQSSLKQITRLSPPILTLLLLIGAVFSECKNLVFIVTIILALSTIIISSLSFKISHSLLTSFKVSIVTIPFAIIFMAGLARGYTNKIQSLMRLE